MDNTFTSYQIEDRSFVSYVKREIHSQVSHSRFTQMKVGEIDIVVSELSSNLIKHAGGGEMLCRLSEGEVNTRFEILTLDNGPGIPDVARMMRDGVSTTGTLGHGLGAIDRLSSQSQIYSIPGWGTIVYAAFDSTPAPLYSKKAGALNLDVRSICVNKPREVVCGDGYFVKRTETDVRIFFGDGLGHGQHAKDAIEKAVSAFRVSTEPDPADVLRLIHEQVRRTRGMVATVAIFDLEQSTWRLCGVGNINTRLYTGIQFKNYVPYNGTIGMNIPNSLKTSVYEVEKNQHLIMCSDGIRSRWDLNKYQAIFRSDPIVLAGCLYKDFSRRTDDSSVLIAKVN